MNNKLIKPVVYLATGILTFIFMALDYFKTVVSYGGEKVSQGMNASDFMEMDVTGADGEIFKKIAGIALIGVIIAAVVVILVGIAKLLPAVGVKVDALEAKAALVDKVAAVATKALVLVNFVAVACTFAFGMMAVAEYNKLASAYGGGKITMTPAIGAYLMLVIAFAAVYAGKVLAKKAVVEEAPAEEAPAEEN